MATKDQKSTDKKKEVKDSNEVLNIFMIVIGAIFIFQGIIYYTEIYAPGFFGFLPDFIMDNFAGDGEATQAFQNLIGDSALIRLVLGGWCFISGVGMFQEQEWAWGQALVLLSVIIVTTAGGVITSIVGWNNANLTNWSWWISIVSVAFAALGILWLLGTKERYH
nr:hypothetical protein [Candidatus Sigynarchaeota archaeon]